MDRMLEILLVEDNPGDADLAREALEQSQVNSRLSVVSDGEEALEFLYQRARHVQAPRPDLILLDLNLPRKNGHEVLAEIKADPELEQIPVVVLTTSRDQEDVIRAYDLAVNCYMSKPLQLQDFHAVVRVVEEHRQQLGRGPGSEQGR